MPSNILLGRIKKKHKKKCFFKKMCMFFIQFSSSCKQNLVFFPLCVLCVVLIFECILLQCEFAKDIISLVFSLFCFIYFWIVTNFFLKTANKLWIWYYAYFHVSVVFNIIIFHLSLLWIMKLQFAWCISSFSVCVPVHPSTWVTVVGELIMYL